MSSIYIMNVNSVDKLDYERICLLYEELNTFFSRCCMYAQRFLITLPRHENV
jgi:hypothetical protein